MAKHLNVELNFSANTRQAQQQLRDLQGQMDRLFAGMGSSELPVTKGLVKAQSAAASLQVALNHAMNQDTGKLDLLKFSDSINKAGLDINQLSKHMNKLGPDGQKAFMTLTQSIIDAEVPAKRTSLLLKEMWTTMKNTARWQISSSIMHGFQSTLQAAMGYAKDLDKSLTNIRIVTGQSTDEMARFAEQANKAAKALSTTTTKYTDAALIYYQQGLSDQEVIDRTNVTIKMANVAGQTAEVVSDQMTAVWNNFYDGSKTLEYYADVMTALGATTASSTEEIATGLNKFAAVADTVGLSYEYAASALATVTATTRQSADVVGTAFRTLFTRIQGLSLGETLDDGTTLNKYSEALNTVGVNIKDQHGQLKEMDQILAELGAKWDTISKDQQVALAQTIGGARQYTTLIALMDNWSFFQENLGTSLGSEGTLTEQAEIYAESWEAAQKRTKAALQGIYDSLLDEDLFIGVADSLTTIYTGLEKIIDSMGGMSGVVLALGSVLMKVFNVQFQKSIENIGYSILSMAGVNEKAADKIRQQAYQKAINMKAETGTAVGDQEIKILQNQTKLKQRLYELSSKMTDEEKEKIGYLMEANKQYSEMVIKAASMVDAAEKQSGNAALDIRKNIIKQSDSKYQSEQNIQSFLTNRAGAESVINTAVSSYTDLGRLKEENFSQIDKNKFDNRVNKIIDNFNANSSNDEKQKIELEKKKYESGKSSREEYLKQLEKIINKESALSAAMAKSERIIEGNADGWKEYSDGIEITNTQSKNLVLGLIETAEANENLVHSEDRLAEHTKLVKQAMQEATVNVVNYSQVITNSFQGITQLLFGLNSLKTAFDTLNNDDLSFFEKLTSLSMTLSMGLPALINAYNSFAAATATLNILKEKENALTAKGIIDSLILKMAKEANLVTDGKDIALKSKNILVTNLLSIKNGQLAISYGTLALYIGVAIGAIALLVLAFKHIKENTPEAKIAKANEELERMKKATAAVRDEMSNLISTISNLESSRLQIAEMEQGTVEWLEASLRLHDELKGIAETYGLLDNFSADQIFTKNEHGYYTGFSAFGQEQLDKMIEETLWNSQLMSFAAENKNNKIITDQNKIQLYQKGGMVSQDSKTASDLGLDALPSNLTYKSLVKNETGGFNKEKLHTSQDELNNFINRVASGEIVLNENLEKLSGELEGNEENILNFASANDEFAESLQTAIKAQREYENSLIDTAIAQQVLNKEQAYDKNQGWVSQYTLWEGLTESGKSFVDDALAEVYKTEAENIINASGFKGFDDEEYQKYLKSIGYKKDGAGQWTDAEGNSVDYKKILNQNKADLDYAIAYQKAINDYDINANKDMLISEANKKGAGHIYTNEQLNARELNRSSEVISGLDDEATKEYLANKKYLLEEALKDNDKYQEAIRKSDKETADKIMAQQEQLFNRIAGRNANFNVGFKDILDNYKEYYNVLKDTQNINYPLYLDQMRESFSKMMDIDGKFLSEAFLTSQETLDLMKKAAEGDFAALDQLAKNTALSIVENANISDQAILNNINNLITAFDTTELKIGASLETGPFVDALNAMLQAGQLTVDQVNAILNSIGFEPDITYQEVEHDAIAFDTTTVYVPDGENGYKIDSTVTADTATGTYYIPMINASNTKYSGKQSGKINIENQSKATSNGSSTKSKLKKESDEIDRYHEIKEVIEDINKETDRLGKAKDRAWGKAKLDLIDKEIDKVNEAIDAQKEYLNQINANMSADKSAIASYGATFDEMGRITNYEELIKSELNKYNAAVSSGDESAIEKAEERYEAFKKALEQYEETADLYEDEWDRLIDLQNEYYDKLLEKVEYEVEFKIQINDTKLEYLEYMLNKIKDSSYEAAEGISDIFENLIKQTEISEKNIETYQKGIADIFANHGASVEDWLTGKLTQDELIALGFTEAEINTLIEYQSKLLEENNNLLEMKNTILNQISESFSAFNEEMQRGIDKISHLKNIMSSFKNIVSLVGKERLGITDEQIARTNEALVNMSINQLSAQKTRQAALKKELDELAERIKSESDEEIKKGLQKQFNAMQSEYEAAAEEMMSTWEETLQQINDVFNEALETAVSNFERKMSAGYGSLDALLTQADRAGTINEQYLSEYKQLYELSKLTRDINNSIDDTDNLEGKRELRELLNEINEIQSQGVQMSAYDLEYLQKKYDLKLAEIALEDAQNAKNQVRMTRDADGNWSYTYTADESAVDGAAQNYEDKLYALQELSNNYLNQISEQWIQAEKEWSAALLSIYQDATLSEEERMQQIDSTNEFYRERFDYFTSEIEKATGNNQVLYEEDWRSWAYKTDNQIRSNESFQTSFQDTVLGTLYDGCESIQDLQSQLNEAIGGPGEDGTLLGDLSIAYSEWAIRVDEAMGAAGTSTEDFGDLMDDVADDVEDRSEDMADSVEDSADRMTEAFDTVIDKVDEWLDAYRDKLRQAIEENELLADSVGDLLELLGAESGGSGGYSNPPRNNDTTGTGPTTPGNTTPKNTSNTQKYKSTLLQNAGVIPYEFNNKQDAINATKAFWVANTDMSDYYTKESPSEYFDKHFKEKYIEPFLTGGYTGEWGSSGKLAMLHEKELVLNAQDTENFLSAVNLVRDISRSIDLNALASQMGLGFLREAHSIMDSSQTIEQEVTIHAEFPNATNHSEIEEAFNNLINTASQYANRKRI